MEGVPVNLLDRSKDGNVPADGAAIYSYTTELGTFRIIARTDIGVALWLDDTWLGTYSDAAAAAADVWSGDTGHTRWDRTHARQSAPHTLADWDRQ